MRARGYLVAGIATAALTAGSVLGVAATGALHARGAGMHRIADTCSAPASLPGRRVVVMLADMPGGGSMMGGHGGMMGRGAMMLRASPQTVTAGVVSLVALNHGTRTHELVVLPLAAGTAVGTRATSSDDTVAESDSLGEASYNCGAGAGDGIRAGGAGWLTLTLEPGRYELICNLPGHYRAGMHTELDVT